MRPFLASLHALVLLVFSPLALAMAVGRMLRPEEEEEGEAEGPEAAEAVEPEAAAAGVEPEAAGPRRRRPEPADPVAVRFLCGEQARAEQVDLRWSVGEVKARVFGAEMAAGRRVTLVFQGRRLDDDWPLGTFGVRQGDAVHAALSIAPREPQAAPRRDDDDDDDGDASCHRFALLALSGGALTLLWGLVLVTPKMATRLTVVLLAALTAAFLGVSTGAVSVI